MKLGPKLIAPQLVVLSLIVAAAGVQASLSNEEQRALENATVELYDWAAAQWVQQPVQSAAPLAVEQPQRFLTPDSGQIRARVSGQIDPQTGGGCVYVDASLKGKIQ